MKQTVFDVLVYLFENYMSEELDFGADQASLEDNLLDAGFPDAEIERAFTWLEELGRDTLRVDQALCASASVRVYSAFESSKLNVHCRGVLHMLEARGIVDPAARERIIDRVMALESDEVSMEQLRWVILMVLFYHPSEPGSHEWMEETLHHHMSGMLH